MRQGRQSSTPRKAIPSAGLPRTPLCFILQVLASLLLFSQGGEASMTVTADQVEYLREQDTYVATGNVRVERSPSTVTADRIVFRASASEIDASGRVVYEDPDTVITAEEARLNLETKTGEIRNAVILFRKDNFWITGDVMEKMGEGHYFARQATFTSCNAEPVFTPFSFPRMLHQEGSPSATASPDWCFRAEEVDMQVGESLTARNATYRIRGLPVLYTPYVRAPLKSDRQTGFLNPVFGNSSQKGFVFAPAFFWAIDDHMDATFYLDYFSKRGVGAAAEFRHMTPEGMNSWYVYNIHDREFDENFFAATGRGRYAAGPVAVTADINYVNDVEFYKEYGFPPGERLRTTTELSTTKRFLQSTLEASIPLPHSRAYVLGEYRVDLQKQDLDEVQKLPEAGFVVNPTRLGPLMFSLSSSLAHLYREEGPRGARLDLMPTISYSFGGPVQLFQSLSLRETAYRLSNEGAFDNTPHRETFEYRANALARLTRQYSSVLHVLEPSVGFRYIANTGDLPLFDSTELFDRVSQLEFSLLSVLASQSLVLSTRLSQPYSLVNQEPFESFLPTRLEIALTGPVSFQFDFLYDIPNNRTERIFTTVGLRIADTFSVYAGERYERLNNVNFYTAGFFTPVFKNLAAGASVSYDATGAGLRDASVNAVYTEQCWGVNALFSRKPGDAERSAEYSIRFLVELKGLGKYGFGGGL